jgi:uncharacterized membrane protein
VREVSAITLTDKVGQGNFLLAWLGVDQIPGFGWEIIDWCHHTLMLISSVLLAVLVVAMPRTTIS